MGRTKPSDFFLKYQKADPLRILALAALYVLLARVSLNFATMAGNVTLLWPASGLALGAMLLYGSRIWPGVFLGAFSAGLLVGDSIWLSAAIAIGNTLEPVVGVWLLKRRRFHLELKRLRDYFLLLLMGAIVAPLASALIGSSALLSAGVISSGQWAAVAVHWWMGDVLGVLLLAPAVLILPQPWDDSAIRSRLWEGVVLALLSWTVGRFVFMGWDITLPFKAVEMGFWVVPFFIWTGLRFGRHGLAVMLPMFFAQNVWGVMHGGGLFATDFADSSLINFWSFHAVFNFGAMTLGIVLFERFEMQKQAQNEKARLRGVIDAIPDTIFFKDTSNTYVFRNQACAGQLDPAGEHVEGMTDFDLFPPDTAQALRQQDALTMACGEVVRREEWISFTNGTRQLRDTIKAPVRDRAGNVIGLVGVSRDITESRAKDRERLLLYDIINVSRDEVYLLDADTLRFRFVNAGAMNNLGYALDEVTVFTPLDINPFIDKDDLQQLVAPLFMHEKEVQMFETMHKRKNGSLYPVEVHLQLYENEHDRCFLVIARDMTARLESEQMLRLAASVFENSKQAILITDADVRIVSVNRMFTELTGFTPEDAIGHNPRMLNSGTHDEAFYQAMWKSIASTGGWSGEVWNRRKDGSIYVEWIDICTVRSPAGQVTNYIGLSYDITNRKEVEENIRHLAQHDFLTGLPNRLLFSDRLEQTLAAARRNDTVFAVLFLDLNRFKHINDTLGHKFGDDLLKSVATRLVDSMRATDTICRIGGDEFVILVPEIGGEEHVGSLLEKMAEAFHKPCRVQEREIVVSFSVGYALYPRDGNSMELLLEFADAAMYRNKNSEKFERL